MFLSHEIPAASLKAEMLLDDPELAPFCLPSITTEKP